MREPKMPTLEEMTKIQSEKKTTEMPMRDFPDPKLMFQIAEIVIDDNGEKTPVVLSRFLKTFETAEQFLKEAEKRAESNEINKDDKERLRCYINEANTLL